MLTLALLHRVATTAVGVVAVMLMARQCRKPAWLPGRLFARLMNVSHESLTSWALGHVQIEPSVIALDIGCGGGATVARLASLAAQSQTQFFVRKPDLVLVFDVDAQGIATGVTLIQGEGKQRLTKVTK